MAPSPTAGRRSSGFHPAVVISAMLCATALSISAMLTHAGPLDPPAGAVSPSFKTLSEVEPRVAINETNTPGNASAKFRITKSGSYYLTGNLTGDSAKAGIQIEADNVTIDLCGFTLTGGFGTSDGIRCANARRGVIIRNGYVQSWAGGGINLISPICRGVLIEDVQARFNTGAGIACYEGAHLKNCVSANNGGTGITLGNNGRIEACTAQSNGGIGIDCGFSSTVEGSTARDNSSHGFASATDCVFNNCVASLNVGTGFVVNRSMISHCRSGFNNADGISGGMQSRISDCNITSCVNGIVATADCIISGCGIVQCTTGVSASASDNRIENNNAVDCTTGFNISSGGNVIVRNSASGGTTRFNIVAGNASGPVINAAAVGTSLIPTANYDY